MGESGTGVRLFRGCASVMGVAKKVVQVAQVAHVVGENYPLRGFNPLVFTRGFPSARRRVRIRCPSKLFSESAGPPPGGRQWTRFAAPIALKAIIFAK
jgi:hypothetical protein